eukprot:scaffold1187_cov258-Pinguiococcus_pyrenoidosus.AAC.6
MDSAAAAASGTEENAADRGRRGHKESSSDRVRLAPRLRRWRFVPLRLADSAWSFGSLSEAPRDPGFAAIACKKGQSLEADAEGRLVVVLAVVLHEASVLHETILAQVEAVDQRVDLGCGGQVAPLPKDPAHDVLELEAADAAGLKGVDAEEPVMQVAKERNRVSCCRERRHRVDGQGATGLVIVRSGKQRRVLRPVAHVHPSPGGFDGEALSPCKPPREKAPHNRNHLCSQQFTLRQHLFTPLPH